MMIGILNLVRAYWKWIAGAVVVVALAVWFWTSQKPVVIPVTPPPAVTVVDSTHVEAVDSSAFRVVTVTHNRSHVKVTIPAGTVVGDGGLTVENTVTNADTSNASVVKESLITVEDHVAVEVVQPVTPAPVVQPVKRFGVGVGALAYPDLTLTALVQYKIFWKLNVGIGVGLVPLTPYACLTVDVGKLFNFPVVAGAGYSLKGEVVALAAIIL